MWCVGQGAAAITHNPYTLGYKHAYITKIYSRGQGKSSHPPGFGLTQTHASSTDMRGGKLSEMQGNVLCRQGLGRENSTRTRERG